MASGGKVGIAGAQALSTAAATSKNRPHLKKFFIVKGLVLKAMDRR